MSFVQKVYKFRQAVTEEKNVLPCLSFLQGALLLWIGISIAAIGTQTEIAKAVVEKKATTYFKIKTIRN